MLVGVLAVLTMIAFAANSLLCRIALGGGLIDPVSFTAIRLISGAVVLAPLSHFVSESQSVKPTKGSWGSGLALFGYAISFSLAYVYLGAGIGALILFGSVQATMIGYGLRSGERPRPSQWLGLAAALGGLFYLVWPGVTAPNPLGALLMSIAGISWGVYSVRGRSVATPILATSGNFARTVPMAAIASVLAYSSLEAVDTGIVLALVSGAATSGLGYVLWYRALRGLSTTKAAILQLTVPVIAAAGGVIFLGELVSTRMLIASALVLGGVAVAVTRHSGQGRT
jgi:drug/metabolite transporter (DMT)-like permease